MVYWWPETLAGQKVSGQDNAPWTPSGAGPWRYDRTLFNKVTGGTTGVPIVDAAVRCVSATGWLHNRLRMVLAMVAVRILKIDWRLMERWFATRLVDYSPASNRGGWEWASSYRFVLNPWVQAERFDRDCAFVKEWIPELSDVPAKDVLTWYDAHGRYPGVAYPPPILRRDLGVAKEKRRKKQ